jgi:hypothetical protein
VVVLIIVIKKINKKIKKLGNIKIIGNIIKKINIVVKRVVIKGGKKSIIMHRLRSSISGDI